MPLIPRPAELAAGPRRPPDWPGASSAAPATRLCSWPPTCSNSGSTGILEANAADVDRAERAGADATSLDRLRLDPARVAAMAAGLRKVAALPDPVGEVVDGWVRPNGLRVRAGAGAARRGRDHLREPAQRDQRRRRAVPQVGQRRAAAGLVVGHRLQRGHRRRPA